VGTATYGEATHRPSAAEKHSLVGHWQTTVNVLLAGAQLQAPTAHMSGNDAVPVQHSIASTLPPDETHPAEADVDASPASTPASSAPPSPASPVPASPASSAALASVHRDGVATRAQVHPRAT